MATEEELIRQLRILYGIAPEGAGPGQGFGADVEALERQLSALPSTITRQERVGGPRGGYQNVTRPNPAVEKLKRQIAEAKGQQVAGADFGEAQKNSQLLDSIFGNIKNATLDEGTRELNQRFVGTLRQDRSRLAARGLTGGSAARSGQARTVGDLLLGRQRLTSAADSADQSARQSLDEQRQATERQIKLGTQPDVSQINALREAQNGLNQAYNGLTQQALGGLLTRGADSYRDVNQADAYGRRGFGTLSPGAGRTGSASGSIY